tara:strand:- start:274 stop:666 length:393 start_codon:yes stop_codon:yes gene_type:complete
MNKIEKATRIKLRFDTVRGLLPVEDLFSLPLSKGAVSLDSLHCKLKQKIKSGTEDSYLNTRSKEQDLDDLRILILEDIMDERVAEIKADVERVQKNQRRKYLESLIAEKDVAADKNMTKKQLLAELDKIT